MDFPPRISDFMSAAMNYLASWTFYLFEVIKGFSEVGLNVLFLISVYRSKGEDHKEGGSGTVVIL